MKFKRYILICFFIFLMSFLLITLNSEVRATDTYNLSDYVNHITSNAYFILRVDGNFYLYTCNRSGVNFYVYTTGGYTNPWSKASNMGLTSSGWIDVYRFNKNTSKFDFVYDTNSGFSLTSLGTTFEIIACNYNVLCNNYSSAPVFVYSTPLPSRYLYDSLPTIEWDFDRRVNTIIMSTQHFSYEDIQKYRLYYTTNIDDVDNYTNLPCTSIGSYTDDNDNTEYFYFLTFDNYYTSDVTYYFILEEISTGRIATSTYTIEFNSLNSYFDNELNESFKNNGLYTGEYFTHGVPTLNMNYRRYTDNIDSYHYEIYSQYFSYTDVADTYIAYYIKDTDDISVLSDYSQWSTLSIASYMNDKTKQTDYYYFFNIPTDSEDTTYYFVLYNKITGQYGSISSINLEMDSMWEYSESISNDNNVVNTQFDKLINSLRNSFGFLFYPFEFIGDLFNRFNHINWEEPIIHIPNLSVPIFRSSYF